MKKKSSNQSSSKFAAVPTADSPNDADSSNQIEMRNARVNSLSHFNDNVLNAADQANTEGFGNAAGNVKFKKAKKLGKKVTNQYTKAMNDIKQSRFQVMNKYHSLVGVFGSTS